MKIVSAQLNYTVGDFESNVDKILNVIENNNYADWIVFTELCLSGYYPMDLINVPGFYENQQKCLDLILEKTKNLSTKIVIGAITKNLGIGKSFFNSLLIIQNGMIKNSYNKQLLPTYDVFDEQRHFEVGSQTSTIWFENNTPRIGFLICEDVWNDSETNYSLNPVADLMKENIDLLITINASPAAQAKSVYREDMISNIAKKYNVDVLYVNQVGGSDALVFDGASFAVNKLGELVYRAQSYNEEVCTLEYSNTFSKGSLNKHFYGPEQWHAQIVLGLKDYFAKCGFKKALIGSSGGIDSAVVLGLAVDALGADNVLAFTMPSEYSSSGSITDSELLCSNLGVKLITIPIKDILNSYQNTLIDIPQLGQWKNLALENAQARIRGMLLMGWSNQLGALVLSTGNKSEMSVGYATLYGDMNGALNPLGDLYKMEVYELARWMNTRGYDCIPENIIEKAPSAELAPGQKDEDSLPPYPLLDAMLKLNIEGHLLNDIDKSNLETLVSQYPVQYKDVLMKLERAEFKRRQAPPIIRVHPRAFGSGWQFPVAQQYKQWTRL